MEQSCSLPASAIQEQFWLIHKFNPEASGYNVPSLFEINGELDREAFQRSIDRTVSRHEILRTTFASEEGKLLQVIKPEVSIPFNFVDFSKDGEAEKDGRVTSLIQSEVDRPFDLGEGPLLRLIFVQLPGDRALLLIVMQHIITDLRSNELFALEISQSYKSFSSGSFEAQSLDSDISQYREYSSWQSQWMQSGEYQKMLKAWMDLLKNRDGYLNFPHDRLRPPVESFDGGESIFRLERVLVDGLRDFARKEKTNLFLLLLASYFVMLHRYSGQKEVIVGVPFTNRRREEQKDMLGCFVNNVPIALDIIPGMSFNELLQRLRKEMLLTHRRQEVPFKEIALAVQRKNPAYNQFFQVGFTFQPPMELELDGLVMTPKSVRPSDIQLDLFPTLWEGDEEVAGGVFFNKKLFEQGSIDRFVEHWKVLLNGLLEEGNIAIAQLPVLGETEKRRLLQEWNETFRDYPSSSCLHNVFEKQVEKTPDALALCYNNVAMSYEELNSRANKLGHYLQKNGVGPETLVGVFMERSVEMVVALYGILKAGGAYVPLDPSFPEDRLNYMMEDTRLTIVLTQQHLQTRLPKVAINPISLDSLWFLIESEPEYNVKSDVTEENLAYVLYTSGSTGRPKGAMNQHNAICNRLYWMQEEFQLTCDDRVMQKTPYSFDVSVWEFFWPLQVGATLIIAPPDSHYDPTLLVKLIDKYEITTIHFVPSMLQLFLDYEGVRGKCRSLKFIVCSGEALSLDHQKKVFSCFDESRTQLYNLYGPTEAAVDVTSWRCFSDYEKPTVPIGRPIANTQLYIVDQLLQPTPVGVPGELLLGGVQVARGYLNRPELSSQSFINDIFSSSGRKLYKTGDHAKYLADGTVEYLGRIDNQVNLHGLRIELGEIQSLAMSHDQVQQAVVVMQEKPSGEKTLVLYVIPENNLKISDEELKDRLRSFLALKLPKYMVPSYVVTVSDLPLTTSGKVDRKALPVFVFESGDPRETLVLENQGEKRIFKIWQRVLEHDNFGSTENFFDVGGDSLLAVMVMTEINKEFQTNFPVVKFFQHPTIKSFALLTARPQDESWGDFEKKNVLRQRVALAAKKRSRKKMKEGS